MPETGILTTDFKYIPASDLAIGDEVVGFDEELNGSRFRKSYITNLKNDIDEVYELTLEDGRRVRVTYNHPLVVRFPKKTSTGLSKKYIEAKDIKVGMRIADFGKWEHERTYESGYVAGQYDGEGSLVGKAGNTDGHLSYYQNEGKGALIIKNILENRGFSVGFSSRQRREDYGVCETLRVNGGKSERIRFLGTFRPQRLLMGAFEKLVERMPFNSVKDIVVVGIEKLGPMPIVRISTSTKTYVADGLCSHNSQFGFGKENGRLFARSKGKEQDLDNPDMMFELGVEYIKRIADLIPDNMTFYGEYLNKPKHNTLAYDNIPKNHIALFGAYNSVTREHFGMDVIKEWAEKLDVDTVPLIYSGTCSPEFVLGLVKERVSYLGGQKIEGVVVKAYKPWMFMGSMPQTVMSGKYVTEEFKEVHVKNWKKENTGKGKLEVAMGQYKSEARWNKAVQHLRDNGELTGTPKDIGPLIKEIRRDVTEEEKEAIKATLWSIYSNDFLATATNGFPQWFKEKLVRGEISSNQEPEAQPAEGEESNPTAG